MSGADSGCPGACGLEFMRSGKRRRWLWLNACDLVRIKMAGISKRIEKRMAEDPEEGEKLRQNIREYTKETEGDLPRMRYDHHISKSRLAIVLSLAYLVSGCSTDQSRMATTTIGKGKVYVTRIDDEATTVAISSDRRPYIAGVFDDAGKLTAVDVYAGVDLAMSVEYTADGKISHMILYEDLIGKMTIARQLEARGALDSSNMEALSPLSAPPPSPK